MTVSVVIVVQNGEAYLPEAIDSVLNQTLPPNEIIVVDGCSTDRTAEIARSYSQVKHFLQRGSGLAGARNFGISRASCETIAFLDYDDYWSENKLQIQVAQFLENPLIQYSYALVKLFLEPGCSLRKGYNRKFFDRELKGRTPGALVVRKSLFNQIGKFNPKYKIACDVDWFMRAQDHNIPCALTPQILLHKRLHESNLSGDVFTHRRELFEVIQESIKRKKYLKQVV